MTNQFKLLTVVCAALLALALQVAKVSAFDSPIYPPPPAPGLIRIPPLVIPHNHPQHESSEARVVVDFGWTAPAWNPLDVSYQAGPEE